MFLGTVRQEAGPQTRQPKVLKIKLDQQGHQARDHSDHIVLMMSGGRLDLVRGGQRCSRESWKTTLGSQGTYSENWHRVSLKKVQLSLSQGQEEEGDEVADNEDYDDVVRTSVSQDQVIATLCTEELFFSTEYIQLSPRIRWSTM